MILRLVLVGTFTLLSVIFSFGQVDSVLLDSAFIHVRQKKHLVTLNETEKYQTESLSTILRENASVYVKPSSGNSLSSLSIRGGTAEQTAILWNGLSLQNTLNGTVDLAIVPTLAFDEIAFNANESTNSGGGYIAGSIDLKNGSIDTTILSKSYVQYGSFGNLSVTEQIAIAHKKSSYGLSLFNATATNDYPYNKNNNNRLEHASSVNQGILFERQQRFSKSNPWNLRLWMQQSDRQIPATILEGQSKKYQADKSIRVQSDWSFQKKKNSLKLNVGSFYETLQYRDSISKIFSDYSFLNSSFLAHYVYDHSKKLTIGADAELRNFTGNADTFYNQNRVEIAEALHVSFKMKRFRLNSSVRFVQYSNSQDQPLLFAMNTTYDVKRNWSITSSFSTNYRMPTFNSLYWNPGGNASLLSERSTNWEIGAHYKTMRFKSDIILYSNYINDQIRWLPGSDGIFEAQQIVGSTQWNRGVEVSNKLALKNLTFYINGAYVRSTNLKNDNQYQQTQVPLIQYTTGFQYSLKQWAFSYNSSYLGKRFIDIENTLFLPSVLLHNVAIKRDIKSLILTLGVRNVANVYYTVLPFMPNAPRNYYFNASYKIHKKKK